MSFYTSLTGLNGSQADLATISNNVANTGTTGFKRSRAEFGDIFATSPLQNASGATGSGTILRSIKQQFTQGNISSSLNALDLAISGQGFFAMKPSLTSTQTVYTRNGSFSVNNDRYVVDGTGQFLQVFPVNDDGSVIATGLEAARSLQLPTTSGLPSPTTKIELGLNLPADAEIIPQNPRYTDNNPYQFDRTISNTFNKSTSITIYDSLGNPTIATIYYVKTSNATEESPTNKWQTYIYVGDEELEPAVITSKNDKGQTLYSNKFGQVTADPQSVDPTFNANAAHPLYKQDDQTVKEPSSPAEVVGAIMKTVGFDFGDTDSRKVQIITDPSDFGLTREGGVQDSNPPFWGTDMFTISVDGSEPVSINVQDGRYTGTELAAEMTRAINAKFGDERFIKISDTYVSGADGAISAGNDIIKIDMFTLDSDGNPVGLGVADGTPKPLEIDLLGVAGSDGTPLVGGSSDPEKDLQLTREELIGLVQTKINSELNRRYADFGKAADWVDGSNPAITVGYDVAARALTFAVDRGQLGPNANETLSQFNSFKVYNEGTNTNTLGMPTEPTSPETLIRSGNYWTGADIVPDGDYILDPLDQRFGMEVKYDKDNRQFRFISGTTGEETSTFAGSQVVVGRSPLASATGTQAQVDSYLLEDTTLSAKQAQIDSLDLSGVNLVHGAKMTFSKDGEEYVFTNGTGSALTGASLASAVATNFATAPAAKQMDSYDFSSQSLDANDTLTFYMSTDTGFEEYVFTNTTGSALGGSDLVKAIVDDTSADNADWVRDTGTMFNINENDDDYLVISGNAGTAFTVTTTSYDVSTTTDTTLTRESVGAGSTDSLAAASATTSEVAETVSFPLGSTSLAVNDTLTLTMGSNTYTYTNTTAGALTGAALVTEILADTSSSATNWVSNTNTNFSAGVASTSSLLVTGDPAVPISVTCESDISGTSATVSAEAAGVGDSVAAVAVSDMTGLTMEASSDKLLIEGAAGVEFSMSVVADTTVVEAEAVGSGSQAANTGKIVFERDGITYTYHNRTSIALSGEALVQAVVNDATDNPTVEELGLSFSIHSDGVRLLAQGSEGETFRLNTRVAKELIAREAIGSQNSISQAAIALGTAVVGSEEGAAYAGASDLLGVGTAKYEQLATTVSGKGLESLAATAAGSRGITQMNQTFFLNELLGEHEMTFTVDGIVGNISLPIKAYTGETFAAAIEERVNLIQDPNNGRTVSGVRVVFDPEANNLIFTSGTTGENSQINVVGHPNFGLKNVTQTRGTVPQITNLVQASDAEGNKLYIDKDGNITTQNPESDQNWFPLYLDEGELTFDTFGKLISPKEGVIYSPFDPANGSDLINLSVDYGKFSTQYASPFSVLSLTQDGFPSGRLDGLDIDASGTVFANYTNGTTEALGKIILVNFANANGLKQVGNANYVATSVSGDALLGEAGSDGFGTIQGGSLERSNVDITEELVNLITAQRNFQANAKAIETTVSLTQSIINIRG